MKPLIKEILTFTPESQEIIVQGWVRTKRELRNLIFVEVSDGSCFDTIQCTFDKGNNNYNSSIEEKLSAISTGCSVEIKGFLTPSPAAGQAVELTARDIKIAGLAPTESYPLQKKKHSLEFLREIAHLRARTNTFGAVARIRSRLAFGIHEFFQKHSFQYLHTPIITSSDAEGAGAMFRVTTLDLASLAKSGKNPDYSKDFFGKETFLSVSGQLEAETYATALSRVYTFGPTFRAENSNTTRHLAEFWMIEPEIAFADLNDLMLLAEDFLKFLFSVVLKECSPDLAFFDDRIEKGIIKILESIVTSNFARVSYTDAVKELEKSSASFEFKPFWGCDLQSEHEKFLTEKVFLVPWL